jgi:hypothetical protein
VLREHDYSGARVPLANLLRCIDALALEVRWHPDIGDDDLRREPICASDQLVVILRDTHDLQVVFEREQRTDSLPDDQVVVGEKDADRFAHRVILSRAARTS